MGIRIYPAAVHIPITELFYQRDRLARQGDFNGASVLEALSYEYADDGAFDRARAVYLADIDKEVQQ